MGIPYSKQINQAFEEVGPLVAATVDIVHTTKEISYLLAGIQVCTAIFQFITVLCLIGLLITINPDLTKERTELVTPLIQYMASWVMPGSEGRWYLKILGWMLLLAWICGCAALAWHSHSEKDPLPPQEVPLPDDGEEEVGSGPALDIGAPEKAQK
ncbi:hypothetical protein LTR85_008307 [Meristemomyces frigidus]|nr:hypothetical protein LTR85_008307 [Meristemomyces frigidus]